MSKKAERFEDDLERLEKIVVELESGVGIDEALKLYEEGMKLSLRLESRLTEIQRKVYEVKNIQKIDEGEEKDLELGLFE
jgi:exodeoxyribonuclease VII small subunit